MRKYLSTGLFGTILGLAVGAPADAALVSRGFLDEALENYATTTALDLKADNADLTNLSNIVGELPDGLTVSQMLTSFWTTNGTTYPGLGFISDYIHRIELAYNTRFPYIFLDGGPSTTIDGVDYTGPVYPLWKLSEGIDKIGTLPSGNFPKFPGYELLFPALNQPFTYPTSLAELINAIYGNSETGGLLAGIIAGFEFDTDGDGQFDSNVGTLSNFWLAREANDLANANATKIGTVPDGKNLSGMISETDAKIGTLPDGYETVGAALTAIKGIAEDAKAAALAAIPDPKTEGSTGKFVLTVDIVGDNATYRWEKIDREGEATTTE